MSAIVLIYLSD